MGGGGGTPGPTYEEKLLGELSGQKYDLAKGLSAGTDYLTRDANVDRSSRYEELALGDTARLLGSTQVETPASPVTGPVDLTANLKAIVAGQTQADLESNAKKTGIAQNALGTVADTTAAAHQEGLRKQAIEQAQADLKSAKQGSVVNAITSIGTAYAMNHKKINSAVSDVFNDTKKLKVNTPWRGR